MPDSNNATTAKAEALHQAALEALDRKEFDAAREGFEQALGIFSTLGDAVGMAMAQHNLGLTCQEVGDLAGARDWLEKSLAISEEGALDGGILVTCHQLGVVAQIAEDYPTARKWFERALELEEKLGNQTGEAMHSTNWRSAMLFWICRLRRGKQLLGPRSGCRPWTEPWK